MSAGTTTLKYLESKADLKRPMVAGPVDGVEQVVVIPALDEERELYHTLASLARNPDTELGRTLVLVVVNNRADGREEQLAANRATVRRLHRLIRGDRIEPAPELEPGALRIGMVDATGDGLEVSGVGEARRIGLDRALEVLTSTGHPSGVLMSLDADTRVAPNYLEVIRRRFSRDRGWAVVVDFEHRMPDNPLARDVIVQYETYLRYHAFGLKRAGSPYGFPTLGSTMVCRGNAYAAVSGMTRRAAGEDFYFLQELQKTGGVEVLASTVVRPSARASERVPFGTGAAMVKGVARAGGVRNVYDPAGYRLIGDWLSAVVPNVEESAAELLAAAEKIHRELRRFLEASGFEEVWPRLQRNAPSNRQLRAQFHRWFDAFRTLRLIHHLRDSGFPERPLYDAVGEILGWAGVRSHRQVIRAAGDDPTVRLEVLQHLRRIQRTR